MRCSKYYEWVSNLGNWRRRNGLNDVVFGNVCQFTAVYTFIIETTQVTLYFNKYSPLILTTPARSYQSNMILSSGQNEQSSNIRTPLPAPQDNSTGAGVLWRYNHGFNTAVAQEGAKPSGMRWADNVTQMEDEEIRAILVEYLSHRDNLKSTGTGGIWIAKRVLEETRYEEVD